MQFLQLFLRRNPRPAGAPAGAGQQRRLRRSRRWLRWSRRWLRRSTGGFGGQGGGFGGQKVASVVKAAVRWSRWLRWSRWRLWLVKVASAVKVASVAVNATGGFDNDSKFEESQEDENNR